jgi:hypothetical protein
MPFNVANDFVGITQMMRVPNVLVMNADTAQRLKINNLADLITYAKANPGKLNVGSGGNGSAGHLAAEMFKRDAGIFVVHIPYNGGNPAQLALLSGQVDFNFDSNGKFVCVSPKPTTPFQLMRQNANVPDDYEVKIGLKYKKISLTPGMILCQHTIL